MTTDTDLTPKLQTLAAFERPCPDCHFNGERVQEPQTCERCINASGILRPFEDAITTECWCAEIVQKATERGVAMQKCRDCGDTRRVMRESRAEILGLLVAAMKLANYPFALHTEWVRVWPPHGINAKGVDHDGTASGMLDALATALGKAVGMEANDDTD